MDTAVISIVAKCCDQFTLNGYDIKGNNTGEYDGYVPAFFPGRHHVISSDYINLRIDAKTGQILNWKTPSQSTLRKLFSLG